MRAVSIGSLLLLMMVFVIVGPGGWGELDGNGYSLGSADVRVSEGSCSRPAAPNRLNKFGHSATSTRLHTNGQRGQVVRELPLTLLGLESSPPTPTPSKSGPLPVTVR